MNERKCPRWERCNAPICPLDANWQQRVYRKDEPICFYMNEAMKPDAMANFQGGRLEELYWVIKDTLPKAISRHAPMKKPLERAKHSGSRLTRLPPKIKSAVNSGKEVA